MQKYINLNAQYGFSQDSKFAYDSVEEIIANMDRLGIWQTTVEFPGGNMLARAQRLIEDIEKIPNGKQRIIPSFVLDPTILVQTGGIEKMIRIMKDNQPCCVNVRAKTMHHELRMVDLVLEKIEEYCSVVLLDYDQLPANNAASDLVALAQRFPNMSFVVRQVMWGGHSFLFDVMSRAKNIYVDNSRLHTRNAIEIFTSYFGIDRVLFSTDLKSNAGAAMASITFAPLTEEEKDQIRFGNFVNLFRKEEDRKKLIENSKVIPNQVKNSFWTPFVEQGIAPDVDIYDVHCHMGTTGNGWYLQDADMDSQVIGFEKDMKQYNVKKVVTSVSGRPDLIQANLDMKKATDGHDGFYGYLRFNPNFAEEFTDEYLDACFATGYFVGLKTLPSYMNLDIRDEKYNRMFSYADKHGLPVLIHCWDGTLGTPMMCAEAAARWPNAKVVLGHSGGGGKGRWESEAIAQDHRYDNVYFEFCGSFTSTRCWEDTLKYIDYKRVFYGTDACLHDIGWEMGRLLSCDIPDEQLIAILGGNAKRIYNF